MYDEALLIVPYRPTRGYVQKEHAWLVHANDALYVCLSGLSVPKPNSIIGQAGLRLNLNASGEPLTQPGDIGFLARTDGEIAQLVDNGDGFRLHTNPQVGYQARIVTSGDAWSAELRIADTLLGGNPRRTRMMINFDAVNGRHACAMPISRWRALMPTRYMSRRRWCLNLLSTTAGMTAHRCAGNGGVGRGA